MVFKTLLRGILFLIHFCLFVGRFWLYNWIRACYYYLKFGPLFLLVRLRLCGLDRARFRKVPRSLGLLVPPGSSLLPSMKSHPEEQLNCTKCKCEIVQNGSGKRKSNQLALSPLGAFLEEAKVYGIERVFLFLYPADFMRLEGTPLYQCQLKPLEPYFTIQPRSHPGVTNVKSGNGTGDVGYESFLSKNANPIDLIISYENSFKFFGIPPLSLINTEFVDSSWCAFRPFSNASLLAALTQYSNCQQRFGK